MKKFTILSTLLALTGCAGTPPEGVGKYDGAFRACPNKPNCVNSEAGDEHFIEPFKLTSKPKAWQALRSIITNFKGETASIISMSDEHIYAEFKTKIMGFVDDVEFHFHKTENTIAIRSASRLGHSDLGANRKRIEKIRASLKDEGFIE